MDSLFGIVGKDFTLLCSDAGAARSIYVLKEDDDRIMELDKFKLLGGAGEQGDRVAFCEYVQKNIQLYEVRYGFSLNTNAAANFIRTNMAQALRRSPYQVNLLLGGYDRTDGPSLYFVDYMGSMHKMEFGVHGYASYFITSVLDKNYRKDMNLEEAVALANSCIDELRKRFAIRVGKFIFKVVSADGIKVLA
jgi:20S proteasome subunit beta 4